MIALSPDHNVGFTILGAGGTVTALSDVIAAAIIPALDQAGKEHANKIFSGTYSLTSSSSSSSGSHINSSITITTDGGPGLKVDRWISNSTDICTLIPLALGSQVSNSTDVSIRLYPTGLNNGNSSRVSFRAVVIQSPSSDGIGPFTRACSTWATADIANYGKVGVDEFVFELDGKTGEAVSVSPRALRVNLEKIST